MRRSALAAIGLALSLLAQAAAAQALRCEDVFRRGGFSREFQSSVEVEIGATPKVIDLFETTDGTLRPVVGDRGLDAVPEDILASLKDFVGPGGDPLSAAWDLLSPAEKSAVIMRSAEMRRQDFRKSRTVPGLKYRERVELTFERDTRFLGADYAPGTYAFPAEQVFAGTAIEFMGPGRMTKDLGFELHVRGHLASGENFHSARVLQRTLGGAEDNLHLHMVAAPPVAPKPAPTRLQRFWRLLTGLFRPSKNDDLVKVVRSADFVRRSMLYFEIRMIENGLPMRELPNAEGDLNFLPVQPERYRALAESFLQRAEGLDKPVKSKGGTVGLRTHHYYDRDVWGLEVRYLSPRLDETVTARDLTTLQDRMISQRYFMTDAEARAFLEAGPRRATVDRVSDLLYAANAEAKLRRSGLSPDHIAFLKTEIAKNDFVKMLIHDWSADPMFAGRPERIAQIREAQAYALRLLLRGQSSLEVMPFFLKKSALSYEIRQMMERP